MNRPTEHKSWPSTAAGAGGKGAPVGASSSSDRFRAWMHEALHDLPKDSRILAVGCDESFFAPHLAEYGADLTVLDTSAIELAQLARRFPDISFSRHHPANRLPFPS